MKIERDERRLDFRDIGVAIKKAREDAGMTQEQLAYIIDRDPRTVMYHENDGQHPSLNVFYQLMTMFNLSVDQFFYPEMSADDACKKRINIHCTPHTPRCQTLLTRTQSSLKAEKKDPKVYTFEPYLLVEISGIEPLTS